MKTELKLQSVCAIMTSIKKSKIVVVVGMHRTGTSLCCQILNMLGIDIASEQGINVGNEKGHYERWEIVNIHNEILEYFNRSYFSPLHDLPLPSGWWSDLKMRTFKDRLKEIILPHLQNRGVFGFKDPRTTKLMPLWNIIFSELELAPQFIVCLRNPAHVARSLHTRDALDVDAGELRTLDYMVDAFRYTAGRDRTILIYDDWFDDRNKNFSKLKCLLGDQLTIEPVDAEIGLRTIIAPEMNRSTLPKARINQQIVEYFYQLALNYERCSTSVAGATGELDTFVKHYTYFKYQASPIGTYVEKLTADKVAADGEVSAQAIRLSEAQAQIYDLSERARHLEAECDHLRHQLREMESRVTPSANPESVIAPAAAVSAVEPSIDAPIHTGAPAMLSDESQVPPAETHETPVDAPVPESDDAPPVTAAASPGPGQDRARQDIVVSVEQPGHERETNPAG